jgi:hypothetical protein
MISEFSSMNSNSWFSDEQVSHVVSADGATFMSSNGCNDISGMPEMSPTLPSFEPKYNYVAFNAENSAQLMSMIIINPQVSIFYKSKWKIFTSYYYNDILDCALFLT